MPKEFSEGGALGLQSAASAQAIDTRTYEERVQAVLKYLSLPTDVKVWCTVRCDGEVIAVSVRAATPDGLIVAAREVEASAELRSAIASLLSDNREAVLDQLKEAIAKTAVAERPGA